MAGGVVVGKMKKKKRAIWTRTKNAKDSLMMGKGVLHWERDRGKKNMKMQKKKNTNNFIYQVTSELYHLKKA